LYQFTVLAALYDSWPRGAVIWEEQDVN